MLWSRLAPKWFSPFYPVPDLLPGQAESPAEAPPAELPAPPKSSSVLVLPMAKP